MRRMRMQCRTEKVFVSDEASGLDELLKATRRRNMRKRRSVTMSFYLGSPALARELGGLARGEAQRRLAVPSEDDLRATVTIIPNPNHCPKSLTVALTRQPARWRSTTL
mmetsp:Transcript_1830/g.5337  ORF Transcript_1830/g.5337 Transcript_1830/m.5337 type:complete len:109 (-) Transcript_1830:232-558(-)